MFRLLLSTLLAANHLGLCQSIYPFDPVVPFNAAIVDLPFKDYNVYEDLNTTIVLPTGTSLPTNGYLYAFNYYAAFAEPFRISVWRHLDPATPANTNGSYILLNITTVIYPQAGTTGSYNLTESFAVQSYDFLGITFGKRNPIPYFDMGNDFCGRVLWRDVRKDCLSPPCYTTRPTGSVTSLSTNSQYTFTTTSTVCKQYALNAQFITSSDDCQLIQLFNDYYPDYILSHGSYGTSTYSNYLSSCWRLRATTATSKLYIKSVAFAVESASNCRYDELSFYDAFSNSIQVYGPYCGYVSDTVNVVYASNEIIVRFTTDTTVTKDGFKLEVRSLTQADYSQYLSGFPLPWESGQWTPSTTTTTAASAPAAVTATAGASASVGGFWTGWSWIERIGFCIGMAVLGVILLAFIIATLYYCCCSPASVQRKKKVAPAYAASPQTKGYAVSQQQQSVYNIPSVPPPPYSNRLPPIAATMPRKSAIPPGFQTQPYPIQRYLQEPEASKLQPASQPPREPVFQPQPSQPTPSQPGTFGQPAQFSLATVAFALRQPKPLKPIAAPFGGNLPQQPSQPGLTQQEILQSGRAKLKWSLAHIPPPATYNEPIRSNTQSQQSVTFSQQGAAQTSVVIPRHTLPPDQDVGLYMRQTGFI